MQPRIMGAEMDHEPVLEASPEKNEREGIDPTEVLDAVEDLTSGPTCSSDIDEPEITDPDLPAHIQRGKHNIDYFFTLGRLLSGAQMNAA